MDDKYNKLHHNQHNNEPTLKHGNGPTPLNTGQNFGNSTAEAKGGGEYYARMKSWRGDEAGSEEERRRRKRKRKKGDENEREEQEEKKVEKVEGKGGR
ncbi:hypothetical protein E2C01_039214 [Portunus trituberculatus]|uniref:Uncharacterized protein n=1 Tax=Portunus trituberculatus TaxID=210409 RepID=A0A5B7FM61_PORTR|nr:hypothetical protein [Portunus trituberculatus]